MAALTLAVGVSSLPGVPTASATAVPPAAKRAAVPERVTERPDRVSAALAARLQGSRVLITGETTESSQTYANGDGTFTAETVSGVARVQKDGRWAPVDPRLFDAGNSVLKARAVKPDLEFSAGGRTPFAKMTREPGKSLALSWPSELPKPTIKDNTATYTGVAGPGGDLVVTALPTGMRFDIVLRERPRGDVEFKVPLRTEGLTVGTTADGRLELTGGKKKLVAAAAAPAMWEAGTSGKVAATHGRRGDRGRLGKITGTVEGKDGGQALVLRPDPSFLADPATKYPVTVDPTVLLPLNDDTDVSSIFVDDNNSAGEFMKAGTEATGDKDRAYLRFNTTGLPSVVTAAQLVLRNVDAPSCGPTVGAGIQVRQVTSAWDGSLIDWSPQPTNTTTGAVTSTEGSQAGVCGSGYMKWNITGIVQAWAGGAANHGLVLRAASETATANYRVFTSSDETIEFNSPPKLSITYAAAPATGTLSTAPSATSGGTTLSASTTPTLRAQLNDADGGTLTGEFAVEHDPADTAHGTGAIWSGSVTGVAAGSDALIKVPAATLAEAWKIRWRARAYDGGLYSSWSNWQYVTIDSTAPTAPAVACSSYPSGAWSPKQPAAVGCTLDSDAADFSWGLDDPSAPERATGDPASITIDPADGLHTLTVTATDAAGNISPVTRYTFGVGTGEVIKPAQADRTQGAVTLASRAEPGRTSVRYEYRSTVTGAGSWAAIPTADVSVPGSPGPIVSWPQTRANTAQDFADLYWNVAVTLAGRGDGPVQVRACFPGSPEKCSDLVTFTLEATAFGSSYATRELGPGGVALLTGDYGVQSVDASAFGLAVSRGHTTLAPPSAGVFGPGWVASLPSGASAVSGMTFEDHSSDGYVLFTGPEGGQLTYTLQPDGTFAGVGDAADGSTVTKNSATQFTHDDAGGVRTVYALSGGSWGVTQVDEPGDENTSAYVYDAQRRVTRMIAPAPAGVTCSGTLVTGCKAMDITYATTTTATGVTSGWGDYAGQVKQISYIAYDPATSAMKTTAVASYAYDTTGHLRQVTDPRTALSTVYQYNAEGRISQLTPPGLNPWRMEYDNQGRIAHVQREAGTTDLTHTISYGVPLNSPVDVTGAQAAAWGQTSGLPRTGTAIFPPSRVPPRGGDGAYAPTGTDYPYGVITYLDVNGRAVNEASFGAGAWQVSSRTYDDGGHIVWALSAGNRALALTPTADVDPFVAGRPTSAERAALLSVTSTYNGLGDLVSWDGPAHRVILSSGSVVTARQHTENTYDEGKPDPQTDYQLLTTTTVKPLVLNGTAAAAPADTHSVKLGYAPIIAGDTSGWDLRKSTTTTTVVGGGNDVVEYQRFDAAGREIERRTPKSNGSDAGTTTTAYFTSGAHPTVSACGNKPQWAGLLCRTGPAAQPVGVVLPITTTTYDYYGQTARVTETSGTTVRTTTTLLDSAGRPKTAQISVAPAAAGGTAVPDTTLTYDAATGLQTHVTAGGSTVVTSYDALGRVQSVTDAEGNVATTTYDTAGRVATLGDGKGTSTFTYGGTDALGKTERREVPTAITASGVGTFTGAYDGDGQLISQGLPNGLTATGRYDVTGKRVALTYSKGTASWLAFSSVPDIDERTVLNSGPGGSVQRYSYDSVGRLKKVADTYAGTCATRQYDFDKNTNRSGLTIYGAAAGGACATSTVVESQTHAYDAADRATDSGYIYDTLGRTIQVPGDQVAGGGDVNVTYHANDLVADLTQGALTKTFTLDPLHRIRTVESQGGLVTGTVVNHYAGDGDSPAWITELDGTWTRNVTCLAGMAAIQKSDGSVKLQIGDLRGNIIATVDNTTTASGVDAYFEQTEYGTPRDQNIVNPDRYGWLGGNQRPADALGGIILMGARLYNPHTGRFLQMDPAQGGSCNDYDYTCASPVENVDLDGRAGIPADEYQNCLYLLSVKECLWGFRLAEVAKDYDRKYHRSWFNSPTDKRNQMGKDGSTANAFRHAFWNAMMVFYFTLKMARVIADNHELYGKETTYSRADLLNNTLGRNIGLGLKAKYRSRTYAQIATAVRGYRLSYWCTNGKRTYQC
ncbi:sugar-binding protein [Sphaerisporangium album]|uniref:Sugar-binding protein n=1 Tax=Sphaerisporangium album TaxID=509200 RepID=A0A367FRH5_9ACTN|nr:sugar-binding protein [Sphaerisporangium album]